MNTPPLPVSPDSGLPPRPARPGSVTPAARFSPAASAGSGGISATLQFSKQLERTAARCSSPSDLLAACAELLRRQAATFVGRYRPAGTRIGESELLDGLTAPTEGLDPRLQDTLTECCRAALAGSSQVTAVAPGGIRIHAAPYLSDPAEVLVALSGSEAGSGEHLSLMTGMAACRLSENHLQHSVRQAERGSQHAAALVELMSHLDQCRDIHEGSGRLSRELQRYLQAERVMIGHCDGEDASCVLIADTQQEAINPRTEETQLIQAVLEECVGRRSASVWPASQPDNRHALLAHSRLATSMSAAAICACPLTTEQGRIIGAIILSFAASESNSDVTEPDSDPDSLTERSVTRPAEQAGGFLTASSHVIAGTLQLLDRSAPGLGTHIKRLCHKVLTSRRRRTLGIVTAAVMAVLLLPVKYKINCDAELQPVERRFVATPFDGTLQECLVHPGDYVEQGTLLALMDEREIQWELAGVQADMSRARKERDSYLAEHSYGDAAIARHEVERLQHRSDLLAFRSENLELRSPIDGIVVSGDHKHEEGVPLNTGDALFEIAPLDQMIVEIAVPEEDIRFVREGMPVHLQLDAMPSTLIDATVARVYPSAELKDHENVFVVEARIPNRDSQLRPGMRGSARIAGDRHTLGWNLFHKPAAWLVGWLGW